MLMELMPMQSIPMPCMVSCSGGTRYRCRVWHLLEVTGIYAADTMNQIPMAMMPIEPMPIPYPCSRYRCRVWHLLEVTGIYAADTMNQMPMAMMLMPCVVSIQPTP